MHRLVAVAALSLLASLPHTRGGTPIEDGGKCCLPAETTKAGVGPYVSVFGGANVFQSGDVDSEFFNWDLQSNTGWFAGLKIGYGFKTNSIFMPAVELEGFYNRTDFEINYREESRSNGEYLRYRRVADFKETADERIAAIMLNGLMRFDLGRFRPYIGGGIGVAHTWYKAGKLGYTNSSEFHDTYFGRTDRSSYAYSFPVRDTREWSFAAQGIAGLEFQATNHIGIFVEYKALWLRDALRTSDYVNHLVGGGVRFYF